MADPVVGAEAGPGPLAGPAGAKRRRGASIRLKLAATYLGFALAAWTGVMLMVAALLRYLPDGNLYVADSGGVVPNRSDLLRAIVPLGIWGTVLLVALGSVGGWVLAGWVLRPLDAITAAAREARAGTLDRRIDLPGPDDELRRLADAIDGMLGRLQRSFEEQRRFSANVSHELRTPLAVTRTMLEVAVADPGGRDVERLLARLAETNDRSVATVDGLLRLARVEHTGLQVESLDLADVAQAAIVAAPPLQHDPPVELTTDLRSTRTTGDRALLVLAVRNLVENARRHNLPVDGTVRLMVGPDAGGRSAVRVESTGPVIESDEVARFTEPFVRRRGRTSGPGGSGLGLSLVDAIARAHDADLRLEPRPRRRPGRAARPPAARRLSRRRSTAAACRWSMAGSHP